MYDNPIDEFFHIPNRKERERQRLDRLHMMNTMCNRCENRSYCTGGIVGCGSFRLRERLRGKL